MIRKISMACCTALALGANAGGARAACSVDSDAKKVALVELYTSEGCSSCPPADEKIARLQENLDPGARAVALALHVNYWDYMGWKDPYAQAVFSERQGQQLARNGQSTAYTPHFFVSGRELAPAGQSLRDAVRTVNAQAAAAHIHLAASRTSDNAIHVDVSARVPPGAGTSALFLVLSQSGLRSQVIRGENSGRQLHHDHVARQWIGPIALVDGQAQLDQILSLPAGGTGGPRELVAFVEDQRTGNVLQAVETRCAIDERVGP